ncbi:ABC-type amino acid transport system permease subunit [Streptomyces sp. V4I23]|uniref:amino acid ABC transporter permease n=1 Tax=Streptomyces sp. V4I23 TaxID=3042282 RepID=UPI002781FE7C|nr:amino acid ABC transporter permease [Streptomyces sp. V4I23]MDQ1011668.1 ABC-type amino acid transport system permease subunit [Streptomyces sp. V4I23]
MSLTSDSPKTAVRPDPPLDAAALTVVPVRHPWRWAAVAATAVVLTQFLHGLITNPAWEWDVFARYLYKTLQIGIPFGPGFLSFDTMGLVGALSAAVIGLALHQAAYAAEIVRGGLLAVETGQLEAAAALGIPRLRQLRRIVLPQAMRSILPNAANEIVSLFKGTSIVSVMAIGELFYQVQVVYGRNGRVVQLLMVATVWYVLLTAALSVPQHYVERHYAKGAAR